MQIVEVKNNLAKVNYNTAQESLVLSGFVVIKDFHQSFIGQIIHLESSTVGNFAVVKLLFNFDNNGVITNYNGSIPSTQSLLDIVQPEELLELLPVKTPILMGNLAQQKTLLKLDLSAFEKNLLVCSEKEEDSGILVQNIVQQLADIGKKVLIIDLNGNFNFSQNKIKAGKDFKLPLNYESINFIYKEIDNATAEAKALIQEIFLEVQNYVKTLEEGFIPFESFKGVVDKQYEGSEMIELVLLKNKLLKYYESGVFAQEQREFNSLKISLENPAPTVFDLSNIDEKVQREMMLYAVSLINSIQKEVYVILNINDSNSDKKLLKQIFMTKNLYPIIFCPYSYKYLKELKQVSKDLILFAPIHQQNDFAGYSTFLNKLNSSEFIIYGQATHHLPLIIKLEDISTLETKEAQPITSEQDLLDEQIRKDVDRIYTAPKSVKPSQEESEEFIQPEQPDGILTEDDLDLIENLGVATEEFPQEESVEQEITITEQEESLMQEEPELVENTEEITTEGSSEINEEDEIEIISQSSENIIQESQEEIDYEASAENLSSQIEQNQEPPSVDILSADVSATPIVPVYSADIEPEVQSDPFEQGDEVTHPKYGKGVVEKMISYGSKTLCSINFDNVGRRLLDPTLAEIKKI